MFYDQLEFDIRCEWGEHGVAVPGCDERPAAHELVAVAGLPDVDGAQVAKPVRVRGGEVLRHVQHRHDAGGVGRHRGEDVLQRDGASRGGPDGEHLVGRAREGEATVRLLRKSIASPLNILASPKAAPLPLLREIGVNRVSFGPFLLWSCLRTFSDITDSLLTVGDYSGFNGMLSKAEVAEYQGSGQE